MVTRGTTLASASIDRQLQFATRAAVENLAGPSWMSASCVPVTSEVTSWTSGPSSCLREEVHVISAALLAVASCWLCFSDLEASSIIHRRYVDVINPLRAKVAKL